MNLIHFYFVHVICLCDGASGAHLVGSSPFNLMPMLPPARPGTLLFAIEQRRTLRSEGEAPPVPGHQTSHPEHPRLHDNAAYAEPQEQVAERLRRLIRTSIVEGRGKGMREEAGGGVRDEGGGRQGEGNG